MNDQRQWHSQAPRTEYHTASAPPTLPAPALPAPVQDQRTDLITKIWSRATGMLALCIPLMAVMEHQAGAAGMLLPMAVVAGATVTSGIIWLTGQHGAAPGALPPGADPQQLKALEQRLFNLETMDRYERLAYEERMTPVAPPASGAWRGTGPSYASTTPIEPLRSGGG